MALTIAEHMEHLKMNMWVPEMCQWCWEEVQFERHLPIKDLRTTVPGQTLRVSGRAGNEEVRCLDVVIIVKG